MEPGGGSELDELTTVKTRPQIIMIIMIYADQIINYPNNLNDLRSLFI